MNAAERNRRIKAYDLKVEIAKMHGRFKQAFDTDTDNSMSQGGRTISRITARLYLGSKHGEADRSQLKRLGITHILQVGSSLSRHHPGAFAYKSVELFDMEGEDLLTLLPQCLTFLNQALSKPVQQVFVHCHKGVSRSASVVIAFLMLMGDPDKMDKGTLSRSSPLRPKHLKMGYSEALERVKDKRSIVNPNIGFQLQLRLLEDVSWTRFEDWAGWDIVRFYDALERMGDNRTVTSPTKMEPATLVIGTDHDEEGPDDFEGEANTLLYSALTLERNAGDQRSTSVSPLSTGCVGPSPLSCVGPRSPTCLESDDPLPVRDSPQQHIPPSLSPHSSLQSKNMSPSSRLSALVLNRNLSSGVLTSTTSVTSPTASDGGELSTSQKMRSMKVQTIPDQQPSLLRSASLERRL